MKIGMRRFYLFILLFAVSSLLFHSPSDFEAFADSKVDYHFHYSDGSVKSTVEINHSTANGLDLEDNDKFGYSVVNIGDLDGDGVNDLAAGAPYTHVPSSADGTDWCCGGNPSGGDYEDRGTVYILFMNTDGSVESIVEIDDTTPNGLVLYPNECFGSSVANIGDLDGDGVNDLAVGATGDNGDAHPGNKNFGAVYILFMNTDGSVKSTVEIDNAATNGPTLNEQDRFGWSVANIGDLDGDGVNDLASGAPLDRARDQGAVHIMFMNTDGSIKSSVESNSGTSNHCTSNTYDYLGTSIAGIGDLDGDGVNDMAVGAWGDDGQGSNRGAVRIMFMDTNASVKSCVEINDSTANGPDLAGNDYFGIAVANIGDLDGDGVNDLAAGATGVNAEPAGANRGAVHIMFMNTDGSIKSTVEINTETTNGPTLANTDKFGYGVTEIGDLDGNCVNDLAVGAPQDDMDENGVADGANNRGTVHIIFMEDENPDVVCVTSSAPSVRSSPCSRHTILGNCGTIAINDDVYRIIHTWTNVPTAEVLVGEPVTVTLSTPNNPKYTKIHFASVFTEIFGSPTNYEQNTHVDYSVMNSKVTYVSQSQLFQVAGATHRVTEDPNTRNLDRFEVVFTMIFAKPMETSHIVVETENKFGIPETLYLTSALKVNENLQQSLTLEEKSKFELEYEPVIDKITCGKGTVLKNNTCVPELIMDTEVKVTCGEGTVLKDNLCVPKEWSFFDFFEQLIKLFG